MQRKKKELSKNQVAILTAAITSVSLIIVAIISGIFSSNTNQKSAKTNIIVNPEIKPVFNNQINTKSEPSDNKIINSDSKNIKAKNVNTGVNHGIIGDNGIQNFGIQQREITEQSETIKFLLSNYTDKSIRIGFVAPSQEGEILNLKNQIIKILTNKGYTNIEESKGIRIMLNAELPIDKIVLINNGLGGVSFYIPSAIK